MKDSTRNFNISEFSCKCGLKYPAPALSRTLQEIRDWLGRSVGIVSGWRCTRHNKDVGSKVLGAQGAVRGQCGGDEEEPESETPAESEGESQ
jgi:hypothetical protein